MAVAVDIVIDNYNYGRFLGDAVETALAQTHPRTHVIVVDDGSDDDSLAVLERYGDRIEVVAKENGGQASALNAGLDRCRGDVVMFLDADDFLRPGIAAAVAAAFAANPAVVQVQYRLEVVDGDGNPTGALNPPAHVQLPGGDLRRAKLTFPFDVVHAGGTTGNAYRIDALRELAPIPEHEFARCADWYLVHLIPLFGEVVALDGVGGAYRVHGANSYAPQVPVLDLGRVHQTVEYASATRAEIHRVAEERGIELPYASIRSVSALGNRLISLALDPERHPVEGDTPFRLARWGTSAAWRRWDVSPAHRLVFAAWFWAFLLSPRRVRETLAVAFLFPERRGLFSRRRA